MGAKNGEKERERERLNDGDNNGQAMHGAHKHAWRTQAAWANGLVFGCETILKKPNHSLKKLPKFELKFWSRE